MTRDTGIWLSALVTLAVYSYLFKENPVFRMIEHFYVGIASGHAISMAVENLRDIGVKPLLSGQVTLAIPLLLGLMFYAKYVGRPQLSRLPMAVLTGIGAGTALRSLPSASVVAQVRATMVPLTSVDNVLLGLGVISTLAYFLFTTRQSRPVMALASIGKVFMMITFGASFGATVFAGHSLIVGSLNLILGKWLGLLPK